MDMNEGNSSAYIQIIVTRESDVCEIAYNACRITYATMF